MFCNVRLHLCRQHVNKNTKQHPSRGRGVEWLAKNRVCKMNARELEQDTVIGPTRSPRQVGCRNLDAP